jgi:serine/threonine protein kinase
MLPFKYSFKHNILVDDDGHACLCDFGLGNIYESVGPAFVTSVFAGSMRWMAPELVLSNNDPDIAQRLPRSTQTDVYSFGSVVFQVCLFNGKKIPNENPC